MHVPKVDVGTLFLSLSFRHTDTRIAVRALELNQTVSSPISTYISFVYCCVAVVPRDQHCRILKHASQPATAADRERTKDGSRCQETRPGAATTGMIYPADSTAAALYTMLVARNGVYLPGCLYWSTVAPPVSDECCCVSLWVLSCCMIGSLVRARGGLGQGMEGVGGALVSK